MAEYSEASSKKSRKPYTLTKARESWSNDEHERFIKALQLYNRDWKKIETYVGTKTVVQIRSHAQKYFQKIMKSGITDAIPPPRPKRRASDPPHGAPCHTDAKHMRLLSDVPSRQGSGKDEDSDEGLQVHHIQHAGHLTQQQHQHTAHHRQHTEIMEPSAQLEAARAVIGSQGLQHVYLFMASLFSQQQVDLPGMLQRLSARDRHVLEALLKSLVEELAHQQHSHQHSDQQQHHSQHVHLPEDDQHDDQHLQEQQHLSGSAGQSNGATANTTAGTTAAPVEQAGHANPTDDPTARPAAVFAAAGGPSAGADDSAEHTAVDLQLCNGEKLLQQPSAALQQQPEGEQQVHLIQEQPAPQQQQQLLLLQEHQEQGDLTPDCPQQQQQQQQAQVDAAVAAPSEVQPPSGSSPGLTSPAAGLQEDGLDALPKQGVAAVQESSPAAD